jgi:hypothetical protein
MRLSTIPRATATSAPGKALGAHSLMATRRARVRTASSVVRPSASCKCVIADHVFWKKLSPLCSMPSAFPSCPEMISSPVPALNPASTGSEMKSARNPRLNAPATSRMTPVNTARVATTWIASSLVSAPADARAAAVNAAIVDVVVTDSGRDLPIKAYTSNGTIAV